MMYIVLDQSKACYDASDIFEGYFETLEDLDKEFKFKSRKDDWYFTVLDTTQRIYDGGYNCKEYSPREIFTILDEKFPK